MRLPHSEVRITTQCIRDWAALCGDHLAGLSRSKLSHMFSPDSFKPEDFNGQVENTLRNSWGELEPDLEFVSKPLIQGLGVQAVDCCACHKVQCALHCVACLL